MRREQEAAIARIKAEAEAKARAEARERARLEEERRAEAEHEARLQAQVPQYSVHPSAPLPPPPADEVSGPVS